MAHLALAWPSRRSRSRFHWIGEVLGHDLAFAGTGVANQPGIETQLTQGFASSGDSTCGQDDFLNEGSSADRPVPKFLGKLEDFLLHRKFPPWIRQAVKHRGRNM